MKLSHGSYGFGGPGLARRAKRVMQKRGRNLRRARAQERQEAEDRMPSPTSLQHLNGQPHVARNCPYCVIERIHEQFSRPLPTLPPTSDPWWRKKSCRAKRNRGKGRASPALSAISPWRERERLSGGHALPPQLSASACGHFKGTNSPRELARERVGGM